MAVKISRFWRFLGKDPEHRSLYNDCLITMHNDEAETLFYLCSLKTELSRTIFSSSSISSLGRSAVMKALTETDTSSGSWVSDSAVCTTWNYQKWETVILTTMATGITTRRGAKENPTWSMSWRLKGLFSSNTLAQRSGSFRRTRYRASLLNSEFSLHTLKDMKWLKMCRSVSVIITKTYTVYTLWWAPGHTVLSRKPRRPGGGLAFRSNVRPRCCHRTGFLSGSVRACCYCLCRSWLEHCGWLAPRTLLGFETPATAAEVLTWEKIEKKDMTLKKNVYHKTL